MKGQAITTKLLLAAGLLAGCAPLILMVVLFEREREPFVPTLPSGHACHDAISATYPPSYRPPDNNSN